MSTGKAMLEEVSSDESQAEVEKSARRKSIAGKKKNRCSFGGGKKPAAARSSTNALEADGDGVYSNTSLGELLQTCDAEAPLIRK